MNCIVFNKILPILRQFYNAPKTTLCDICDEKQCSQDCLVARQRQAEEEARVNSSAINVRTTFSLLGLGFIAFSVTLTKVLTN